MKEKIIKSLIALIIGFALTACVEKSVQQQIQPTSVARPTHQATQTHSPTATKILQPSLTPHPTLSKITTTSQADECVADTVPPDLLVSPSQINNNDKLIAFSTQYHSDIDWGYADVYVVRFDGTGLKQLTFNQGDDGGPTWSPDGKKILFYSDRNHLVCSENELGCGMERFIINPDGTGSRKLTPDSPYFPDRSPDGKYIVYSHDFYDPLRLKHGLGDYLSDILIQRIGDPIAKNITGDLQPSVFMDFQWSPSGKQLTFIGLIGNRSLHAYLVNADSSNLQKLPGGPFNGYERAEAWSPDGQKLAFLTARGIAVINANGSEFAEFPIEKSLGGREIYWLDDGQSLIFTNSDSDYYKINPDFTGLEKLTFNTDIEKLVYRFHLQKTKTLWEQGAKHLSPDGKWIAYFGCSGRAIRVINTETHKDYLVLDGEKAKQGLFQNSDYETSWGFGNDLAWAPDSRRLIFTHKTLYWAVNQISQSLFVIDLDGTGLRQIETGVEVWFPEIQP